MCVREWGTIHSLISVSSLLYLLNGRKGQMARNGKDGIGRERKGNEMNRKGKKGNIGVLQSRYLSTHMIFRREMSSSLVGFALPK